MGRRKNSLQNKRSAIAVLDATSNFNIEFSANSVKKQTTNKIFPKSISCHQLKFPIESTDSDSLEDECIENQIVADNHEDIEFPSPHMIEEPEAKRKNQSNFPYDVWETIGNYILPESIASFGRICKDSYAVVNLPSFWIRLYRDFAYDGQKLPVDAKGLKSKVIRHLFKEYFPFSSRITSARAKVYDPHVLVGLTCISHQWKLCDCEAAYANRRVRIRIAFGKSKSKSLWETIQIHQYRNKKDKLISPEEPVDNFEQLLDTETFDYYTSSNDDSVCDVNYNPEESNMVLQLELSSFRPGLPDTILGMKLQSVCVTATGPGFRYQKLSFKFVPQHVGLKQCSSDTIPIDIGDVCNIKILKWYHPCYPHTKL